MSARKYRHEDGTGRKRLARTSEPMDFPDAVAWLRDQVGLDGYEAMMPRGTEVEFYSHVTPEEEAIDAAWAKANAARTEKWERETYDRLRAKFDPAPSGEAAEPTPDGA